MARGQATGVVSHGDIATATSELDIDDADREELTTWIESQEIELVDDDPSAAAPRPSARPTSAAVARRSPRRSTCAT